MNNEEVKDQIEAALQAEDHEKSTALIQQAALSGDPLSMFLLAIRYRDGLCLPESIGHSEFWLRMAAEHGNWEAIIALSFLMSNDSLTQSYCVESEQVLTKALNRGYISLRDKVECLKNIVTYNQRSTKSRQTVYDLTTGKKI